MASLGKDELARLRARKGAVRRSEVPADVLAALNAGHIETCNLVEWLSIDMPTLLQSALAGLKLKQHSPAILAAYAPHAETGITVRMKAMGRALHEVLDPLPDRDTHHASLAAHPSDMVRSWAGYMLLADITLPLVDRLEHSKPFAADSNMAVRECAWDIIRPHLASELAAGLRLLRPWTKDPDANIRRCAIEATRPRGVWTAHITALKDDPSPALPLLENVKSDPSRYVQNATANWLNDASKSRPDWVRELCARWEQESPTPQTAYIIRRATRTLRK